MMGEGGVIGLAGPETWEQALRTNLGDHIAPKAFYPAPLEVGLRELLDDPTAAEKTRFGPDLKLKKILRSSRTVAQDIDQVYQWLISRF